MFINYYNFEFFFRFNKHLNNIYDMLKLFIIIWLVQEKNLIFTLYYIIPL